VKVFGIAAAAIVALAVATFAVGTSQAATAGGWKKVAQANDTSMYTARATVITKVRNASKVKIRWGAVGQIKIDGHVSCTNDVDFESRDFSFYAPFQGSRNLPLPIPRGNCSYFVSASMTNGGSVVFSLWAWR
jgi:hypothetical protein